jgi:NitT/TauT family transport system permease protein
MAADQALLGLDNLELGPGGPPGGLGRVPRNVWAALWPKLVAVALVLVVWELVILSGYKPLVLKGPGPVFSGLWHEMLHGSPSLWGIIGATLETAVIGYALALAIGSVVGLLVARIPVLRSAVGSIITGLLTMPSIVWVPFAIILFGDTQQAILFVVTLGAAPSIAAGVITGVDYTPPLLLRAGKTMGLKGFALYRYLVLPAALPAYVAGLKQGWAFGWHSLMAGEIVVQIVGQFSIGQAISVDQQNLDFTGASGLLIVILVIGLVVDTLFTKLDLSIRRGRGLLDPAQTT